ncbi:MAG: hypothetical protein AAFV53_35625 [Myxococcota bacterium]
MPFLIYLFELMLLSEQQLIQVIREQEKSQLPLGRLALEEGMLTVSQVFDALRRSADRGERFGEACMALGFLNRDQLIMLLGVQQTRLPSVQSLLIELDIFNADEVTRLHAAYRFAAL